ncbi:MAG: CPBP family intramembrane metalloprotease [Deltaproteobacteria bacterium]|nr:CPBP family intramembrane metalloprotease [Deltaproteobacteria bacterium]
MQNIFHISESWHDPLPGLNRTLLLVVFVLSVECLAFFLRNTIPLSPLFLMGIVRLIDIVILFYFGAWTFQIVQSTAVLLLKGLFSAFFLALAGFLFMYAWKSYFNSSMLKIDPHYFRPGGIRTSAFFLTACLLSPTAEELFFRGLIYRRLRAHLGIGISMAAVTLLFIGLHFIFSRQIIIPLLGSLVFCLGYEVHKSIFTPLFLHIFGNLLIYLSPLIPFI